MTLFLLGSEGMSASEMKAAIAGVLLSMSAESIKAFADQEVERAKRWEDAGQAEGER
jgi:hypothetical protein